MSWEQLSALAKAYAKRDAEQMLAITIACQGDAKSWKELRSELVKKLTLK